MKKHYCKRKKVVIDIIDGKIINDNKALKISNINEYLEKNGIKILKIIILLLINISLLHVAYAYDSSYMTKLDLSVDDNVYLLLASVLCGILLVVLGLKYGNYITYVLGNLTLFFVGIILIVNGFNVVLSILLSIIPLILILIGSGV
jgi:hypothetical protein